MVQLPTTTKEADRLLRRPGSVEQWLPVETV
jgi:hypothetical protein